MLRPNVQVGQGDTVKGDGVSWLSLQGFCVWHGVGTKGSRLTSMQRCQDYGMWRNRTGLP